MAEENVESQALLGVLGGLCDKMQKLDGAWWLGTFRHGIASMGKLAGLGCWWWNL